MRQRRRGLNGIVNVLLATVEPGQEVVICDPVYAGLVNRIRLAGGVPRFVSCTCGPVSRHRAWVIWDAAVERIRFDGLTPGEASRRLFTRAQVAAMISCGRMLLGRLTGDTATFRGNFRQALAPSYASLQWKRRGHI